MNILILINSFRMGGAEKLSYDITSNLRFYDECNVYLCAMGEVKTQLEKKIFSQLCADGIRCISLNKPPKKGRFNVIFDLGKIIRKYGIDIVHSNGQSPNFYARLIRIVNKRIRVVSTIHSSSGYSKIVEALLHRFTDTYIAVSRDAQTYAKSKLGIKKEISIIENGIDVSLYGSIPKGGESFVILTVARFSEQKNYSEAVQMITPFLKKHREAIWRVFGDTEENYSYYQSVLESIKNEGILNSVQIMGSCIDAQTIYRGASCFLLASDSEGFGLAFIEAMAIGLPVFAKKVGCLKDICEMDGEIFDISKINTSGTLENMYLGIINTEKMSKVNKRVVEEKYSIANVVKQYHDVYVQSLRQR